MSSSNSGNAVVLGSIMALIAGTSFGVGGAASQVVASHGFTTLQICVAQFIFAFIVMGSLTLFKFRPVGKITELLKLSALGAFTSISAVTYYVAIDLTSVGTAVALQFQYVWIAVAIQCVVERRLPGKWTVISTVLIIVGTVMGSGIADEFMAGGLRMNPLGIASAFACAVGYACFIVFSGKFAQNEHPVTKTFFTNIGGLTLVIVATLVKGDFATMDVAGILPWTVLMGMLMAVLPNLCIVAAGSKIEGGLVAILTSSELPMAVIAGALLLNERVTPLIVIGVVIILASIVLAQRDNKGKEAA